jgi:hypothetical protein
MASLKLTRSLNALFTTLEIQQQGSRVNIEYGLSKKLQNWGKKWTQLTSYVQFVSSLPPGVRLFHGYLWQLL